LSYLGLNYLIYTFHKNISGHTVRQKVGFNSLLQRLFMFNLGFSTLFFLAVNSFRTRKEGPIAKTLQLLKEPDVKAVWFM
jgi:hypothetical protein